ncbi:hypothetical protein MCOR25_005510 [Pyricularia grisea]|nr:hypothetical protein MCOR25_005510 [Pyricularia grisea]
MSGQYVYLCVPGVSRTSFSQLHPFYVAWWYREGEFDYAVFIIKKYTGFTKLLVECNPEDRGTNGHLTALIEGPYGKELELDLYGTVLLFATGIGIAGQLSYVSQLLRDYRSCETKTRRIALFWQVRSEVHLAYVADRMQELLSQDKDRVLEIHIYVLSDYVSQYTQAGDLVSLGERIGMTYGALDVTDVLDLEISQRKGRIAICLCVDEKVGVAVRRYMASTGDDSISLKELDFQPETHSEGSLVWAKRLSTGLLTAMYRALRSKIAQ